jgi:TonB family protein
LTTRVDDHKNAERARIEGRALLECGVLRDGTIGAVRVLRSCDRLYGLDEETINAAREWRFAPGTQAGSPWRFGSRWKCRSRCVMTASLTAIVEVRRQTD